MFKTAQIYQQPAIEVTRSHLTSGIDYSILYAYLYIECVICLSSFNFEYCWSIFKYLHIQIAMLKCIMIIVILN